MDNNIALAVVASPRTGHVMRQVEITTFQEALELHRRWPGCDIGLFLGDTTDGDMWCYWPEFHREALLGGRDRW